MKVGELSAKQVNRTSDDKVRVEAFCMYATQGWHTAMKTTAMY